MTKGLPLWRVLIFTCLLGIAISPLILIKNSLLQFIGATSILLFGLYLNAKYLDKRPFSDYGIIFSKLTFSHILAGSIIGFISVLLMMLTGKAIGVLQVSELLSLPDYELAILFAIKMFLVATLEETFFRGYLFTNIYDGFKSAKLTKNQTYFIAALISSVLFGFAHLGNNNASLLSMLFLTINGMVWCIPFIITKNLGLSIGLHMAWNFT